MYFAEFSHNLSGKNIDTDINTDRYIDTHMRTLKNISYIILYSIAISINGVSPPIPNYQKLLSICF